MHPGKFASVWSNSISQKHAEIRGSGLILRQAQDEALMLSLSKHEGRLAVAQTCGSGD